MIPPVTIDSGLIYGNIISVGMLTEALTCIGRRRYSMSVSAKAGLV